MPCVICYDVNAVSRTRTYIRYRLQPQTVDYNKRCSAELKEMMNLLALTCGSLAPPARAR
jgi:hypothetical protein